MIVARVARRRARVVTGVVALVCSLPVATVPAQAQQAPASVAARTLPAQLSDQEFWKFVTDMSEPAGYFRSENLVSNETGLQWVIPSLLKGPRTGRVYLGVGPEQNYTYIASLKPRMAIIIDVRRGNMFQHLLYKALFELSANRAEFIEKLFSKPRAPGLDTSSTAEAIAAAYWNVFGDSAIYKKNREAVKELLARKHGFPLSEDDWIDLFWIYDQFYYNGLPITYSVGSNTASGRGGMMPDYRTIMEGTDAAGINRGFLGSESAWRTVKELHARNLIVPVVGNFGGPKAIKAVGAWLKERNALVGAFYASNVEQYLFQDGIAHRYYESVGELPTDSASVIIRSGRGNNGFTGGGSGMRAPNVMCPIETLLRVNREGRISVWGDVFNYCTQ